MSNNARRSDQYDREKSDSEEYDREVVQGTVRVRGGYSDEPKNDDAEHSIDLTGATESLGTNDDDDDDDDDGDDDDGAALVDRSLPEEWRYGSFSEMHSPFSLCPITMNPFRTNTNTLPLTQKALQFC